MVQLFNYVMHVCECVYIHDYVHACVWVCEYTYMCLDKIEYKGLFMQI